jgi:hypothetical protein
MRQSLWLIYQGGAWVRRFLIDDHEKGPTETMTMIATKAGTGIWLIHLPKGTQKISSITPAKPQDSRPRRRG